MIKLEVKEKECKVKAQGNNYTILNELLSVNNTMFKNFIFRKELNIPPKDKYEIIDAFIQVLKEDLEKLASF